MARRDFVGWTGLSLCERRRQEREAKENAIADRMRRAFLEPRERWLFHGRELYLVGDVQPFMVFNDDIFGVQEWQGKLLVTFANKTVQVKLGE
jgi:hypothetical protein